MSVTAQLSRASQPRSRGSLQRRPAFCSSTIRLIGAVFCLWLAPGLSAQQTSTSSPLSLQQAVRIALEKNPERKIAPADIKAASADARQAKSLLLPRVDFSETIMSGNDPVYVFGSKLRQQRFTSNDFALNVLNTPTPFSNFGTRFGGRWNLFDSFASWHRIAAADHMSNAASHQLERADQEIVFRVVEAYYRVLLAQKQTQVAEQSIQTAQAILDRSRNRYESGVVVESDYLTAQVRLASRKQESIRAHNALALARAQLGVTLGLSAAGEFEPTEVLAERNLPAVSLAATEKTAVELRPDLKRVNAEELAQQQNVSIAKSAFGPRVTGFADWELDNPNFSGGGGNNWMAGVQIQIDLFQGGAKRAQLAHEKAVQEKVAAAKQMAIDAVRLDVRRSYYELDAAHQQVEVARASIADSQESLRINQNRYDSGLSTITDVLTAEENARRTQTDYWDALCRYYTSYANLELARGTLNSQSVVVMP